MNSRAVRVPDVEFWHMWLRAFRAQCPSHRFAEKVRCSVKLRMCSAIAIAIGSLAVTASSVQALPGNQEILFSIFEDPADPQSVAKSVTFV